MEVKQSFHRYANVVRATLGEAIVETSVKGKLRLIVDTKTRLLALIDELERGEEFQDLVQKTSSAFSKDYHRGLGNWQHAIQNFFRRSSYYLDISERPPVDDDLIFKDYCEAFERRDRIITYLAPLEFVAFADDSMEFGAFQLRRFKASELADILQLRVNNLFYPWAVTDVTQLENYWFVYLKEQTTGPQLGHLPINLNEIGRLKMDFSVFPKALESVLYPLALFEWEKDWWKMDGDKTQTREQGLESGWSKFHVPFLFRVDDNPILSPRVSPDLSKLETIPALDPSTGAEVGEERLVLITLDESQTESFTRFVETTRKLLPSIKARENDWEFFEIALGYFLKAFCEEGFEQLLWHITTLEALLGEKGDAITERLARRIASILANTNTEKKAISRQFKELYDFRSTLVHGATFRKQVYIGHLREARTLARKTLLWFLYFLSNIQRGVLEGHLPEKIPARQDILTILDIERNSRPSLAALMAHLSDAFPFMPEWTE